MMTYLDHKRLDALAFMTLRGIPTVDGLTAMSAYRRETARLAGRELPPPVYAFPHFYQGTLPCF